MICISSARSLSRCTPEIASNQIAANESWNKIFDHIIIFGEREAKLDSGITTWVPAEGWPKIKDMMQLASRLSDWSCILNADIFVSPELGRVEDKLRQVKAACAMSYRYEYNPTNPLVEKKVVDNGLDIFCAVPEVWSAACKQVPDVCRMGHSQWDTWTIGFFNTYYYTSFYDFTPARVVFHPKHGSRTTNYEIGRLPMPFEANAFAPPMNKIR